MENKPRRIQRKRTRGWRVPANTVYVGRPTRWGNPAQIVDVSRALTWAGERAWRVRSDVGAWISEDLATKAEAQAVAVEWYYDAIVVPTLRYEPGWLEPLRGMNLACWCPVGAPCHADVLLFILSEIEAERPIPQELPIVWQLSTFGL
jgi:hypothetical protein